MADRYRGSYSKVMQVSTSENKHSNFIQSSRHDQGARKSWRALRLVFFGLLSGIATSLGHHFFYNWLNGKAVDSVSIPQAWTLRIGNLLAFLVKLCFATTVGVSLVQLQWLKFHSYSRTFAFKDVDAVSGIQMSLFAFFDSTIWLHFPSLTVLAMLYWMLFIIPVITPGTLTVITSPHVSSNFIQVPKLDTHNDAIWSKMSSVGEMPSDPVGTTLLSQMVLSTAIGGQLLRIPSNYINETYVQNFVGPSAKCSPTDQSVGDTVLTAYNDLHIPGPLQFFSWVGGDYGYQNMTTQLPQTLSSSAEDICRLYVMRAMASDYEVTECNFYNSTYTVEFSFEDGQQSIRVLEIDTVNPISASTFGNDFLSMHANESFTEAFLPSALQLGSYLGLVEQFGSLLVGRVVQWVGHLDETEVDFTKIQLLHLNVSANAQEFDQKLEELFQNMTISLLSESSFWSNATGSRADKSVLCDTATDCERLIQPLEGDDFVNVTSTFWLGTYSYDFYVLFITYGLSFGLSLACAAAGFYAYIRNNGSYQNVCSTFIRAIVIPEEQILDRYHDDGADPRPKILSNTKVTFTVNAEKGGQSTSYQITRKPIPSLSRTLQLR